MQRLLSLLFLLALLLVSAWVHGALAGTRLHYAEQETESVTASHGQTPESAGPMGVRGPASASTGHSGIAASSPVSSAEPLPGGRTQDPSGLSIADWTREGVMRVGGPPIQRESVLLPILMYHHVRPIDPGEKDALTLGLTLPPRQFEEQLRYLKERGFRSASLEDLVLHFQGRRDLAPRSVIFTFDDGYRDNYLFAYPMLVRYGFKGTFFVITGYVGDSDYLTWWQLREMVATGMEIGGHTVTHPDLVRVSAGQRDRELVESKRALEENLAVAIRGLSYPNGSAGETVVAAARRAGYTVAVTTQYGATHEREKLLELPRIRVQGYDTLPVFRWKIEQYLPVGAPPAS